MDLSVIIVNYNVKYFLEQALRSVEKASVGMDIEVFVVDNNSVDDSVEMVKEKFPDVHLIANKHNPGFSIANNQAIKLSKGRYVLLLNPDTVVEEDTFRICVDFMDRHPDAGGLGVKMIDGSGNFLPESKRGFPSPFVAFCKTFGLSSLFPKSETFNRYHLGYLDKDENHEIDVLAGAFMLMRKATLDKVGLLDEAFFMYGEDIDLSYRIVKGGYKNYYLADTRIIHYKGESTKKGSLNYVKTFYNAMIIFAKKHFQGEQAWLYIFMLKMAIYFRAFITLFNNFVQQFYLPFIDASLIAIGMYYLKNFWAVNYFNNASYYSSNFMYINVPLYITIWLTTSYFSGAYDRYNNIKALLKGLFLGTIILAAIYGFLNAAYRPSRILIVLGAVWAVMSMLGVRMIIQFLKYRNFNLGQSRSQNLVIVGDEEESKRVLALIHQSQVYKNFIGTVAPNYTAANKSYLSGLEQLDEVVQIYKIDEVIFCSKNVSSQDIMRWMTKLGNTIAYKIVPEESLSIIGSSSKNTAGELYTIDIQYNIAAFRFKRSKRLFDILVSLGCLLFLIIIVFLVKQPVGLFQNIFQVLLGHKSWVGYSAKEGQQHFLPKLKASVLTPVDAILDLNVNEQTVQHLNFLYAKDYSISEDLNILWNGYKNMGRR